MAANLNSLPFLFLGVSSSQFILRGENKYGGNKVGKNAAIDWR